MAFTTLISTTVLASRLADPSWVVVDCRFKLEDGEWGEREWSARHIPGAVYAHLDRDLSGPKTGANGRHPLPDADTLARTFGRLGITSGMQVVVYDQDSGMFASRMWWLLHWLGHDAAAVLDGGIAKWIAEGRPTAGGDERRAARDFLAVPRPEMVVGADQVAARIHDPQWRLLDARAPERYRGDSEPIDRIGGHVPGAVDHFFRWNLDNEGTFRAPQDLRAQLLSRTGAVAPDRIICYCGSGVTACHNLLALEHAGIAGAKLYPGSWSEWTSDPRRPIETGPELPAGD